MSSYARAAVTAEEREKLILEHLPQVRWIASAICERISGSISQEDLVATGVIGLISAIDNFDPSRNASLRTYAEYKIRGAILDSLRGLDGVPGHKRKRAKQVEAAIASAEQRLQRAPEDEEIAAELGISVNEYHEWLMDVRGVSLGSLDRPIDDSDGGSGSVQIADSSQPSPAAILEKSELEKLIAEAIQAMPKTERTVISLYYKEELTLAEIAGILNLHTSRVSQLKLQATLRLRTYVSKRWPVSRGWRE
jgi:RNA polymerase sigma factor for flagellar operon FliA